MERLDQSLVTRHMVASRTAAVRHIRAGEVLVNGEIAPKAAMKITASDLVELTVSSPQYASRAGHKLAGALEAFPSVQVAGARCLDAGASTGGFTDVLLQHDAREVVAIDVGHNQIVSRLRYDPRVEVREGMNVRYLVAQDVGDPFDVVVSDLSFISLTLVLRALAGVSRLGAELLLMVKPQFEIGRAHLPKTGVVTDPYKRRQAVMNVVTHAIAEGLVPQGLTASPLPGQDGNKEFFLWASKPQRHTPMPSAPDVAEWVDAQQVDWADALD